MPARPRHIGRILQQQDALSALDARVRKHQQLLADTCQALPAKLRPHCVGAVLEGSALTVLVDSPVWNAKLRFHTPQLLGHLRKIHPGLANIRVRVAQHRPAPRSSRRRPLPRHRSSEAASIVQQASSGVTDPALSDALARLATILGSD